MSRKRDRPPEIRLQRLIEALESDDPRRHKEALEDLLAGPMRTRCLKPADVDVLRAELLAFLRSLVVKRHVPAEWRGEGYGRLEMDTRATFGAFIHDDGRVTCSMEGLARDLAILNLVVLLQLVGLPNVRICPAPTCQRMFVKRYRREYCSTQCQERINKQNQRKNQRLKNERRAQQRLARKRQAGTGGA